MTPVTPAHAPELPAPVVSVIVPVHNVAAQVGAAIASLRAQTLTAFEALVIDDGSTDGAGDVALRAIAGDPRFRLIRQTNQGLPGARNTGIAQARGDWLAFLDGDDRFDPAFLDRLLGAAQQAGVDWAASGVMLCYGDGAQVPHSAIHGSPDPAGMTSRIIDLHDAATVARHFPSAWNKVYRRVVFGDLRFPEGTWFEDHQIYWAFAARAPRLLHLPESLVLHSRDRAGQITGADDDRVFDLFGVLDRLRPLVAPFDGADRGMAELASRLIHERALVLYDPGRRARFIRGATDWLAAQGLAYTTRDAPDLSETLGLLLTGQVPLSVVVPVRSGEADSDALRATLTALRDDARLDGEVVVVGPGAQDVPPPAGLALTRGQPQGRFLMLLPPGAVADPGPLVEGALRHQAALALGALRIGPHPHDGWLDPDQAPQAALPLGGAMVPLPARAALALHPAIARMILRRDLLDSVLPLSVPLWHPLAGAELVLRAALKAGSAVMLPDLVAHEAGPHGLRPAGRAQAMSWARGLDLPQAADLPGGWRLRLALRGLRGGLPTARSVLGPSARLAAALALRMRFGPAPPGAVADLGTDRLLCTLLRLQPARVRKVGGET